MGASYVFKEVKGNTNEIIVPKPTNFYSLYNFQSYKRCSECDGDVVDSLVGSLAANIATVRVFKFNLFI